VGGVQSGGSVGAEKTGRRIVFQRKKGGNHQKVIVLGPREGKRKGRSCTFGVYICG
jgi:hypothetical protein